MNRPSRKLIPLLLLSAIAAGGCSSNLVKSLSSLNRLQKGLNDKYGDEVNVKLQNSRYLFVIFVNSPLNKTDSVKRYDRAQDAAKFVAKKYEEIKSIDQIWVSFVAAQTRFGFFHYTQGIETFAFHRNGAPFREDLSETDTDPDDVRAPVTRFSPARGQTDVSVTRIQLEGDMNKGVALVPSFVVNGDARRAGNQLPPPELVNLDFASFSDKPLFSDNAPLEIYCDDRLAIKGSAHLLSKAETGAETNIAQFLRTAISYRGFYRMAKARSVKIRLGARVFELAPEDLQALNRLTDYTAAPFGNGN